MIDAYQATVIAAVGDGFIVHWKAECLGLEDGWPEAGTMTWQEYDAMIEDLTGFTPLIRYSIHEIENENWAELEYVDEEDIDFKVEPDYQAETVTLTNGEELDVSTYIGVFCDHCLERIE